MKNFGINLSKYLKRLPWKYIAFLCLVAFFFSFCIIITYDGGHYLGYVAILDGELPYSNWDIVRGPVFPIIIYLFNLFFGKTEAGLLVGMLIFYCIFAFSCYRLCQNIFVNFKHKNLFSHLSLIILIINPLIFGYFHVLLTEFIAITFTVLNILIAYNWIFINTRNKFNIFAFTIYFIFSVIFCYHLKQPYVIISFTPLIIAAIIGFVHTKTVKSFCYRFGTVCISAVLLLVSIFGWNVIVNRMGADSNTGRDSSSMLGMQLLLAYQIDYDNDGDGRNDKISTADAISLITNKFFSNPTETFKIFLQNYCGLTSMCVITTPNGIDFTSTSELAGLSTYENTFIGYATYRNEENISSMTDEMYERASIYESNKEKSLFAQIMEKQKIPSNLFFKISTIFCLPFLILLFIIRFLDKQKGLSKLFYLCVLLLGTASLHMIFSAGVGLIIDRYAIEIVAPSAIGICGTIIYIVYFIKQKHSKTIIKIKSKI